MKTLSLLAGIVFTCLGLACQAQAFDIQEVTSPRGIKAWLVESHQVPVISMSFSFTGGSSYDPPGKEGAGGLATTMMGEGADDLPSAAFKSRLTRLAAGISFWVDLDTLGGNLGCLSKNCDEVFTLLKKAISKPRFDADAFDRVKAQALQSRRQELLDQNSIAYRAWFARAYAGHSYGNSPNGSVASTESMTIEDLRAFHRQSVNRRTLKIVVAGDITPDRLGRELDKVFADLPAFTPPFPVSNVVLAQAPAVQRIDYEGPQSVIYFGNPSVCGDSREAWASFLLGDLMGGPFFSRLNDSIRIKAGITYGISMSDTSADKSCYQLGSMSTANDTAEQALLLLQSELARMAKDGPTAEELKRIKNYELGNYPLRFTNTASITAELIGWNDTNVIQTRTDYINAITVEDVKKVAAKLLKPENQIIVMVGRPSK